MVASADPEHVEEVRGFEQMCSAQPTLVRYERQGHVATITLNRPDKRNAFNANLVRALRQALADFDGDPEARVAVLCGAGKAFSSGADVQERQMRTPEEFARLGGPQEPDAHTGDLFVRSVNWKPVIAAVHGAVMGLGSGCGVRVRSCRSRCSTRAFRSPKHHVASAVRGFGACSTLAAAAPSPPRLRSPDGSFRAEEAHKAGLVCAVAPDGRVIEHAGHWRNASRQIRR